MDVDLEVEVAADGNRVAGLPHRADALAGVDALAAVNQRRLRHMSVEVRALLAFAVDQEVVAVENWVVAGAQDHTVADGDERRAASRDDVESLVRTTTAARRSEFADGTAGAVWAIDRENVIVIRNTAVGDGDASAG